MKKIITHTTFIFLCAAALAAAPLVKTASADAILPKAVETQKPKGLFPLFPEKPLNPNAKPEAQIDALWWVFSRIKNNAAIIQNRITPGDIKRFIDRGSNVIKPVYSSKTNQYIAKFKADNAIVEVSYPTIQKLDEALLDYLCNGGTHTGDKETEILAAIIAKAAKGESAKNEFTQFADRVNIHNFGVILEFEKIPGSPPKTGFFPFLYSSKSGLSPKEAEDVAVKIVKNMVNSAIRNKLFTESYGTVAMNILARIKKGDSRANGDMLEALGWLLDNNEMLSAVSAAKMISRYNCPVIKNVIEKESVVQDSSGNYVVASYNESGVKTLVNVPRADVDNFARIFPPMLRQVWQEEDVDIRNQQKEYRLQVAIILASRYAQGKPNAGKGIESVINVGLKETTALLASGPELGILKHLGKWDKNDTAMILCSETGKIAWSVDKFDAKRGHYFFLTPGVANPFARKMQKERDGRDLANGSLFDGWNHIRYIKADAAMLKRFAPAPKPGTSKRASSAR